jgi:hypothetical protein
MGLVRRAVVIHILSFVVHMPARWLLLHCKAHVNADQAGDTKSYVLARAAQPYVQGRRIQRSLDL